MSISIYDKSNFEVRESLAEIDFYSRRAVSLNTDGEIALERARKLFEERDRAFAKLNEANERLSKAMSSVEDIAKLTKQKEN